MAEVAGQRGDIRDLADTLPPADTVQLLAEAMTVDPYNEHLHRRAITALTDTGDHTAAARLHRTYLDRITAAGLHPSPAMTQTAARTGPRTVRNT